MSLRFNLKAIITQQGFTLSQVNEEINKRHNTNLGFQNFSNRLRNETFKYNEVEEILDIVGYDIQWVKRGD